MNEASWSAEVFPRPSGRNSLLNRVWSVAQAVLALIGVTVLMAAGYPVSRDALLSQTAAALKATEPPVANFATGSIQPMVLSVAELEQRVVTEMLSKRYRVAQEAVGGFVAAAYRAGKATTVDPLLILAVISIESRFNPVAESTMGAKGLMQIIPKFHKEKLIGHGGDEALLDPEINILVGAQVLREYMRRFGGIETALQAYAGAFEEPTSQYSKLVLSERTRIAQTIARLHRAA